MEYTHAFGPHWHWSWIVPFLFMILMFVFASRMCRRKGAWRYSAGYTGRERFGCCVPGPGSISDRWPETPDQILGRRYASGEITKEQYDQIRSDLERTSSSGWGEEG